MNWIISANSNIYDHSSSFDHFNFIDWRQGNIKFQINDIVYIYCTRPLKMIQYKCIVEKIDLYFPDIRDDKNYWIDKAEYQKSIKEKFMRLRLIDQVSNKRMELNKLKENGLKSAPQGPMKIKNIELLNYIEKYFTDNYQNDYFPELVNEKINHYEGFKKVIKVNKYERNSKARENAVNFHGLECKVCGINFSKKYGTIGQGFIHIHHLIPIHKIGEHYKINYQTDLIPVCPNCHAMLHRKINGLEPSVEELKRILNK